MGPPSHFPEPKSGCSPVLLPMLLMIALDRLCTGRSSTGWFQGLLSGKILQRGAPGTGALADGLNADAKSSPLDIAHAKNRFTATTYRRNRSKA